MRDRARDCALLLIVSALLTLPNLGVPSLWDMDEGVNAQTAREMQEAETWVIPTFNFQLRTAKPVMLYWFQRLSYAAFGVSEWSARLPSVLAGWLSILLIYELGRRMFDRATGLLAGLVLASVAQFAVLVHAATPDATLLAFTILTYLFFWAGHVDGSRKWWSLMAVACGLAFLTKGPIGLILPAMVVLLYFAWNRELSRLFDRRLVLAAVIFLLVAGPWYALVASETRGEWLRTFFKRENVARFLNPRDKHAGSLGYYLVIVPVMFAPWSAFLLPLVWYGIQGAKRPGSSFWASVKSVWRLLWSKISGTQPRTLDLNPSSLIPHPSSLPVVGELTNRIRAHRFLLCWVAVYLAFFTIAATKLPNYILPIYPAMAVLTARFLVGWREGLFVVPRWMMAATVGGMVIVGAGCIGGVALAARVFPGLGVWVVLGLIPLAAAMWMGICLRQGNRGGLIVAVTVASVVFIGLTVTFPPAAIEPQKAPKELVRMSGVDNPNRDLRVGSFEWLLPSVVYYSGRKVEVLASKDKVAEFLAVPTPGYVFISESNWNNAVAAKVTVPHRIIARHYDFLERGNILVVTNDTTGDMAASQR